MVICLEFSSCDVSILYSVEVCVLLQNWMSAIFCESSPSVQSHSPVPHLVHRIKTAQKIEMMGTIALKVSTILASVVPLNPHNSSVYNPPPPHISFLHNEKHM